MKETTCAWVTAPAAGGDSLASTSATIPSAVTHATTHAIRNIGAFSATILVSWETRPVMKNRAILS